jgi:hypothetical protein
MLVFATPSGPFDLEQYASTNLSTRVLSLPVEGSRPEEEKAAT